MSCTQAVCFKGKRTVFGTLDGYMVHYYVYREEMESSSKAKSDNHGGERDDQRRAPTSSDAHDASIQLKQPSGGETDMLPWDVLELDIIESNNNDDEDDDEETLALLKELPKATQDLLQTAACLGTLDKRLLEASSPDKDNVSQHLTNAAEHGVIVVQDEAPDDSIYVSDETLDSIYRLTSPQEKSRQHVLIGRNLIRNLSEEELQENYYTVLRQFHLGVNRISHQNERTAIANLCLRAGEYAVAQSDFASASRYLKFGISLLSRDSWKDEYDLTLALYNDSAEVESSKSNFEYVDELVATVFENAWCFRDTLRARASRIYSLSTRYQMTEAVDESLMVLNHLGESFPAKPTRFHIGCELIQVWRLLKNKTNERILRMPVMTDPDKIATVQILNLLFPGAYRTRPKLWGLIVLRVVRMTILYGLSPVSGVGFAFYAAILSMITGNVDGSYRYAELALALVDKFQAKEWIPRVYLGVYGHASSYKCFLRDCYSKFHYAHLVGLETGDIEFSCLAATIYCMYHVFSGDSIVTLEKEAIEFSNTFKSHNQETASRMVLPCIQFAQNLMGKNEDPLKLVGAIIKDESKITDMISQAKESHDEMALAFINYYLLVLAYVFNDYEAAAEEARRMQRITSPPYLHPSMSSPYVFYALALLAVYNNRHGYARRRILSIARRCVKKLKKFSLHTPENCLGKALLLQAEVAAVTGKNREARCYFESAISVTTRYHDCMMLAIACERAGRFSSACGDESLATRYFREAHSAYREWGATAKAERLEKEMPMVFVNV